MLGKQTFKDYSKHTVFCPDILHFCLKMSWFISSTIKIILLPPSMNLKYITRNPFHLPFMQKKKILEFFPQLLKYFRICYKIYGCPNKWMKKDWQSACKYFLTGLCLNYLVLAQAELPSKSAMKHSSSFQLNDIYNCAFSLTSVAGLPEDWKYLVMPSKSDK